MSMTSIDSPMEANSRAAAALNAVVLALRNDGGVARLRTACREYGNDNRLLEMEALEMLLVAKETKRDIASIRRMLQNLPDDLPRLMTHAPESVKKDEADRVCWSVRVHRNRSALCKTAKDIEHSLRSDSTNRFACLAASQLLVERFGYLIEYNSLLEYLYVWISREHTVPFVVQCVSRGASIDFFIRAIHQYMPLDVAKRVLTLPAANVTATHLGKALATATAYENVAIVEWLLQELAEEAEVVRGHAEACLIHAIEADNASLIRTLVDCPLVQGTYDALIICIKSRRHSVSEATRREFMRLMDDDRVPLTEVQYWTAFDTLRTYPHHVVMTHLVNHNLMRLDRLYQHMLESLHSTEHAMQLTNLVPGVLQLDTDTVYNLLRRAVKYNLVDMVSYLLSRQEVVTNPFMRRAALFQLAVARGSTDVLSFLLMLSSVAVEFLEEQKQEQVQEQEQSQEPDQSSAKRSRHDEPATEAAEANDSAAVGVDAAVPIHQLVGDTPETATLRVRARMFAPSLMVDSLPNLLTVRMEGEAFHVLLALPRTHPLCPLAHRHDALATALYSTECTKQIIDSVPEWPPAVLASAILAHATRNTTTSSTAAFHGGLAHVLEQFPAALTQGQLHQVLMVAVGADDATMVEMLLGHAGRAFPGADVGALNNQQALRTAVTLGAGDAVRALLAYGEANGVRVLPDILQHARVSCLRSVFQALEDASER